QRPGDGGRAVPPRDRDGTGTNPGAGRTSPGTQRHGAGTKPVDRTDEPTDPTARSRPPDEPRGPTGRRRPPGGPQDGPSPGGPAAPWTVAEEPSSRQIGRAAG